MRAFICRVFGDPGKAPRMFGWQVRHHLEDIVRMMVEAERAQGLQ